MPWLRSGDNAATYPQLLQVAAHEASDDRLVNEVTGFLLRCAMQSAGHMTDYEVHFGTAILVGGSRMHDLLEVACWAGLMSPVPGASPAKWVIVDDPEFIGIRLRDAVMWERQRDRDRKNPELTMPVRLRDGDACRYCGEVVNFGAKSGKRSGTYDHRDPSQAGTVQTLVVACRSCNSSRKAGEGPELLPAPTTPYYHPKTLELLAQHGFTPAQPGTQPDTAAPRDPASTGRPRPTHRATPHPAGERHARPGDPPGTAAPAPPATPGTAETTTPSDPATSGGTPHRATPPPAGERQPKRDPTIGGTPRHRPQEADRSKALVNRPDREGGIPVGSGRDGPGQDGPGQDGTGRCGSGRGGSGASPPRAGRRRGGRGRGRRRGGPG